MRRFLPALYALLLSMTTALALVSGAPAKEAVPLAEDEAVEQRLVAIASELRCLVCQNESLASSRADLAEDLRREIRAQIRQGKTDAQVMDYLVTRYGDFVRYRPPFKPTTWLLWGGPLLMLAVGLGMLAWHLRRRARVDTDLTAAEREQAARLLESP
jgi:cytochrome c-type biogenesis protein CcmH